MSIAVQAQTGALQLLSCSRLKEHCDLLLFCRTAGMGGGGGGNRACSVLVCHQQHTVGRNCQGKAAGMGKQLLANKAGEFPCNKKKSFHCFPF